MPRTHTDQDAKEPSAARRGRPPMGPLLADSVDCSDHARERLRVVLATLAGSMTVDEACEALGIGPSRFHALRARFLADAAALFEPRSPGPAPMPEADAEARREIERLRRENAELRLEATAARVREELAIAMPGRAMRRAETASVKGTHAGKGTAKKKRRVRRSR